jgi:hypothetical protein
MEDWLSSLVSEWDGGGDLACWIGVPKWEKCTVFQASHQQNDPNLDQLRPSLKSLVISLSCQSSLRDFKPFQSVIFLQAIFKHENKFIRELRM